MNSFSRKLCFYRKTNPLALLISQGGYKTYLIYAKKALKAFEIDVSERGLRVKREGYTLYPEYAKEDPPYVLNGFITALIWIKEYGDSTNSTRAKKIYNEGLKALIHFLPRYNAEGWSYYDAQEKLASKKYHRIHVQLMEMMFNLTGERIFLEYYNLWKSTI